MTRARPSVGLLYSLQQGCGLAAAEKHSVLEHEPANCCRPREREGLSGLCLQPDPQGLSIPCVSSGPHSNISASGSREGSAGLPLHILCLAVTYFNHLCVSGWRAPHGQPLRLDRLGPLLSAPRLGTRQVPPAQELAGDAETSSSQVGNRGAQRHPGVLSYLELRVTRGQILLSQTRHL